VEGFLGPRPSFSGLAGLKPFLIRGSFFLGVGFRGSTTGYEFSAAASCGSFEAEGTLWFWF